MAWPKGRPNTQSAKASDEQVMKLIAAKGLRAAARELDIDYAGLNRRRRRIESRQNVIINTPTSGGHVQQLDRHPAAIQLGIQDGVVLVGSDAHYWPGITSTAHRAFLMFCAELKPKVVVMNGDEFDGARVSRWPDGSWEDFKSKPSVLQELEAVQSAFSEIEKATPQSRLVNCLGNHSSRFEMRLLQQVPEYAGVHGTKLKDHLPKWETCWAALVNNDTVIKHRYKGGIHATHNNAMWAGRNVITGHLHSLKVTPLSDYNGTRWGVDCGTMADPYGPQFYNYTELNPLNWRSGFAVLTFKRGKLLWPEVVFVSAPDTIQWRGEEIKVA